MKPCPNCGCGWGEYKPASSGPCLNVWHDRNDRAIAAQRQRALEHLITEGRKMRLLDSDHEAIMRRVWGGPFELVPSTLKGDAEYMKLKIGYEVLIACNESDPNDPRVDITMNAPKETICE